MKKKEFIRALFRAQILSKGIFEPWVLIKIENIGTFYLQRQNDEILVKENDESGQTLFILTSDDVSSLPIKIRKALKFPPPKQVSLEHFF